MKTGRVVVTGAARRAAAVVALGETARGDIADLGELAGELTLGALVGGQLSCRSPVHHSPS